MNNSNFHRDKWHFVSPFAIWNLTVLRNCLNDDKFCNFMNNVDIFFFQKSWQSNTDDI